MTKETLTSERSCTCSRPSQHPQRLPCHALSVAVLCKTGHCTLSGTHTYRDHFEVICLPKAGSSSESLRQQSHRVGHPPQQKKDSYSMGPSSKVAAKAYHPGARGACNSASASGIQVWIM